MMKNSRLLLANLLAFFILMQATTASAHTLTTVSDSSLQHNLSHAIGYLSVLLLLIGVFYAIRKLSRRTASRSCADPENSK